jgi:hypothetical protein
MPSRRGCGCGVARFFVGLLCAGLLVGSFIATQYLLVDRHAHARFPWFPQAVVVLTWVSWVWSLVLDFWLPLLVPLLYPFSEAAWWRILLAWACNSCGVVALVSAVNLLLTPDLVRSCCCTKALGAKDQCGWRAEQKVPWLLRLLVMIWIELSIIPALLVLFIVDKLLTDVCHSQWHWPDRADWRERAEEAAPEERCVVLLHGAGVNQSQWTLFRHLLHLGGLKRVVSVNYFHGFWHTNSAGMGLPECARRAAEQIQQLGLGDSPRVVLVGHSLGALMSAYIVEEGLLPGFTHETTICISGPFGGSDMLQSLKNCMPCCNSQGCRDQEMDRWLVPSCEGVHALTRKMVNNKGQYRLITGKLDPMVLEESAIMQNLSQKDGLALAHVGHFSIAASRMCCRQVMQWIGELDQA